MNKILHTILISCFSLTDLSVLLKLKNLNDKNVLCVWGIVWGMNINTMVVGCYITHLILILLINIGGGGRIWTFDLRVMSPTHCNNFSNLAPKTWYIMVHYGPSGTLNGTLNSGINMTTLSAWGAYYHWSCHNVWSVLNVGHVEIFPLHLLHASWQYPPSLEHPCLRSFG